MKKHVTLKNAISVIILLQLFPIICIAGGIMIEKTWKWEFIWYGYLLDAVIIGCLTFRFACEWALSNFNK